VLEGTGWPAASWLRLYSVQHAGHRHDSCQEPSGLRARLSLQPISLMSVWFVRVGGGTVPQSEHFSTAITLLFWVSPRTEKSTIAVLS
jgi:hypothetical protein